MDYAAVRTTMVQHQLRTNRVTDPLVLQAMLELPREEFVPDALRGIAYIDEDVALVGGRFLLAPLTTALLLQSAEVDEDDVVLEIGCGVGYATAILARMASAVFALECDPSLAAEAASRLSRIGASNVDVVQGPLPAGHPQRSPYDVIVFSGAVTEVPTAIADQLGDGGRLVAVVASDRAVGRGVLMLRRRGVVSHRIVFDATAPLLPGFTREPEFRF